MACTAGGFPVQRALPDRRWSGRGNGAARPAGGGLNTVMWSLQNLNYLRYPDANELPGRVNACIAGFAGTAATNA
jgi:hypothetical protein